MPFLPPGDLPDPGMEPTSSASPALAGGFFTTEPLGDSLGTLRKSLLGSCDLFISFPLNNISQSASSRAPVLRGKGTKEKGVDLGNGCLALVCVPSLQLEDLTEVLPGDSVRMGLWRIVTKSQKVSRI